MRLLLLGKYPPIQGGVSANVYRAVYELAAKGHELHVITNANEVEDGFRVRYKRRDAQINVSGKVSIGETTPIGDAKFIPQSESFEAKLFGRACKYLSSHRCDVIIGWYLFP